jgi:hypothetical protein
MAQRGWITKEQRKKAGSVWVYHWYFRKPETGKKVEHTCMIGATTDFPSEKDAWREVDRRHLKPQLVDQKGVVAGRLTCGDLAASYKQNGMKKLAETTQNCYEHYIDDYLLPRWGKSFALEIEPLEIEQWLEALDGLSNPTKDKIRRIMFRIYTQAQKYGQISRSEASNPVRWVEQSAKSSYKPIVVDPATAAKIFQNLSGMEQTHGDSGSSDGSSYQRSDGLAVGGR